MDVRESKQQVRERALTARAALSADERLHAANAAAERVVALLVARGLLGPLVERNIDGHPRHLTVLTYATHGHEFPSEPVLDRIREEAVAGGGPDVVVVYPRVSGPGELSLHRCERSNLCEGYRAILEPTVDSPVIEPNEVDLVLVPGVAFDERAMRLGYGKGFYDRALESMGAALKVGLSYDETLFASVPCEPHDYPLDAVVTPTRTVGGTAR